MTPSMKFLDEYANLAREGVPFVCVTLVDVTGSTPQDAGSKMLVTRDGLHAGTVGGGRIEATAIQEAEAMLAGTGARTRFVEWNLQRDVGMTCGGVARLFFEAVNHADWHIAIFGAGHVCQALTRLLVNLPCRVTVIDPREEWLAKLPVESSIRTVRAANMPDAVEQLGEGTYVLSMTMGHKHDRPILEAIFRSSRRFPYLGVIGSKSKAAVLRRELLDAGIPEEQANGFFCPIGLPIGSNHPGEIAVSIAAQLIQERDKAIVDT